MQTFIVGKRFSDRWFGPGRVDLSPVETLRICMQLIPIRVCKSGRCLLISHIFGRDSVGNDETKTNATIERRGKCSP